MPLFISDEDLHRLSGDSTAVAAKADAFIRNLLNELDTIRAKADASDINAEQNCSLVEQKYLSLSAEFSKLESHAANLQSTLDQHVRDLDDAKAKNHQFHLQLVEKDREVERLRTEVSELHKSKRQLIELNEQKDLELSEKNTTIRSYLDKIVHLTENAAHKEARVSEVEAELGRCRAACTRLKQEKEIVERQNAWLNEELTAKINSFLEMRRKHTESETDISSKLADVERQFSECSKSLQWNKDRVRELGMKLKSTQEELISAKGDAAANEEQLSAELSTVNKLNELYKESSEEWSRKAADLEGVIKAMESQLKQVEDDYKDRLEKEFSARKQFEKEAADLKEKLEKCEAEIETSKKMNALSNLPLQSFSTEPWMTAIVTDNMDEENNALVSKIPVGVSGTALAASLLRDGWSLAKMYAKYQEAVDALRHEQLGRKESESILQRVLSELEGKAEAIEDERVEHDKMADAYSLMNQKLQHSLNENSNLEKAILELKADLKRHEREYNLAQKEIDDLRKQVTVLLKECQDIQVRCGSFGNNINANATNISSRTNTATDAESIISQHLLTFKDINELVEQNVQLRSLVRSLYEQIENQKVEFKETLEMELKKHTEESASKVAAVLQRAEEQGQMIESLHTSVAMYKRLYEEEHSLHLSHTHSSEALAAAAEVGRNNVNASIESSQEIAKKSLEKAAERVRCLEDELAKSRSEIIVLRSERDKIALEGNFVRELLDSFMKEFEYQREWAEAKKELQEERENVRRLALDRDQTMKNSLRQVEDMSKELTNALGALASAESRAAVAEAKLSSIQKQMSSTDQQLVNTESVSGSSSRDEVVAELQTEKEEIEKLKEEVHANKAHMLQYKSIAEVNEDALKQIESAHEDYKIESELKARWEEEKARLEKSKCDADIVNPLPSTYNPNPKPASINPLPSTYISNPNPKPPENNNSSELEEQCLSQRLPLEPTSPISNLDSDGLKSDYASPDSDESKFDSSTSISNPTSTESKSSSDSEYWAEWEKFESMMYNLERLNDVSRMRLVACLDDQSLLRLMDFEPYKDLIPDDQSFKKVHHLHKSQCSGRHASSLVLTDHGRLDSHLLAKLPLTGKIELGSDALPPFPYIKGPKAQLSIVDSRVGVILLRALKTTKIGVKHDTPIVQKSFICYICNPLLQRYHMVELPTCPTTVFLDFFKLCVDSSLEAFNVLAIMKILKTGDHYVMSYSSKFQLWSNFGVVAVKNYDCTIQFGSGIYCNNCLFWPCPGEDNGLYFDLKKKTAFTFPMPRNNQTNTPLKCCSVNESVGHLYALVQSSTSSSGIDVVRMNEDVSGWVEMYHISIDSIIKGCTYLSSIINSCYVGMEDAESIANCVVEQEEGLFVLLGFRDPFTSASQWVVHSLQHGSSFSLLELGSSNNFCEILQHQCSLFWI